MKRLSLLIYFLLFSLISRADFIHLLQADQCATIMEVLVGENHITVKLEIGRQDFRIFSDVVPESSFAGGFSSSDKAKRWAHFLTNGLILQSKTQNLKGKITVCELRNPSLMTALSAQSADSASQDVQVVYLEIEYPFSAETDRISITPPQQTEGPSICMVAFHKTIPVNDLSLFNEKVTLFLNKEDPWYSYFDNPGFKRNHSSSMMSFLYVEPYEVRHEILVRLKDLEGMINLPYGIDDMLDISLQDSIKNLVADFLVKHNKVEIDGEFPNPIIDRVNFVEVNLSGIQIPEIPKPVNFGSAFIGVIFAFPNPGIPDEINIYWDIFNDKIQSIPVISNDPSGPWPYELQASDSILKWTNFLKHYTLPTVSEQRQESAIIDLPILSIVFLALGILLLFRVHWKISTMSKRNKFFLITIIILAGLTFQIKYKTTLPFLKKATYSQPEAKQLIQELLRNTYRAFDFRNEEDVYDRLAVCNDTELLQELYLQTKQSMVIENQGGLEAKVDEVIVTKAEPVDHEGAGLAFRSSWLVKGEVGHWGHKHRRINRYDAIIKIKPINGAWKMYDMEITDEERL